MDIVDFLNSTIDSFIYSAISRVPDTGFMGYHFSLSVEQIKIETGRERVHESVVTSHFAKAKIDCQYDRSGRQYLIYLDLNTARLSPHYSMELGKAINKFRVEHL